MTDKEKPPLHNIVEIPKYKTNVVNNSNDHESFDYNNEDALLEIFESAAKNGNANFEYYKKHNKLLK